MLDFLQSTSHDLHCPPSVVPVMVTVGLLHQEAADLPASHLWVLEPGLGHGWSGKILSPSTQPWGHIQEGALRNGDTQAWEGEHLRDLQWAILQP